MMPYLAATAVLVTLAMKLYGYTICLYVIPEMETVVWYERIIELQHWMCF